MRRKNQTKGADRRASANIMKRVFFLMAFFGVFTFAILCCKLWQVQIFDHEKYEEQAIKNQTQDVPVSANRGAIYDANGNILAISASVQNVIISPRDVLSLVKVDEENANGQQKSDAEIQEEKASLVDEKYNLIADGLSDILNIDRESIMKRLHKTDSAWEQVATKVEDDLADQVRQFILDNKLSGGVYLTTDSKRYYPYSSLAAQVIGFVNSENKGAYGLEAIHDKDLSGENGRVVTAKNASGTEMLSGYETYMDAKDGYNINLTIDTNIQYYAERVVEEGIKKFEVKNGAFCIVMNPKTGAILAMVSSPNYDLNSPNTITDAAKAENLAAMKANLDAEKAKLAASQSTVAETVNEETKETEEGTEAPQENSGNLKDYVASLEKNYLSALQDAQFSQWRNKSLNDTYEPGSTFKPMVVAAALEEGAIKPADTFHCNGAIQVSDWTIRCSNRNGHGTQDVRKSLMNSCNPALIQIGQRIGAEKFYQYLENFGITAPTGVELQGESKSVVWDKNSFVGANGGSGDIVSLATASFGQRFQVTPIQLITAISSVINGGHLLQPYVVQSVTDPDGNVVNYHEVKEVRQVISQQTSDTVRSMMESVVGDGGTGKNAYVEGYRIGGKTGTSQTTVGGKNSDRLIVSFVGFAPADDPEFVVLLAYDHPTPSSPGSNFTSGGYYISGGNMAAPMAGELIADILDYMGVKKDTGEDVKDVSVPNVTNTELDKAKSALKEVGLSYRTVGSGDTVTAQTPAAGSRIPSGSAAVLYLGGAEPSKTVTVPDVQGRTYSAAKTVLESKGLYIKAPGTSGEGSKTVSFSQSVEAGTEVAPGTVIEVRFTDNSVQDYVD